MFCNNLWLFGEKKNIWSKKKLKMISIHIFRNKTKIIFSQNTQYLDHICFTYYTIKFHFFSSVRTRNTFFVQNGSFSLPKWWLSNKKKKSKTKLTILIKCGFVKICFVSTWILWTIYFTHIRGNKTIYQIVHKFF